MTIKEYKLEVLRLIRNMASESEIETALEQLIDIAFADGYDQAEDEARRFPRGEGS